MKLAFYIANKLGGFSRGTFTSLILKICIATSALSIAVMTIAMSLINGFKYEITDKIYNFWGHITITHIEITQQFAPFPVRAEEIDLNKIKTFKQSDLFDFDGKNSEQSELLFRSSQSFILYPGIIKSEKDFEGIQLKGVNHSFDSSFFKRFLIEGRIPQWSMDSISDSRDIIISEFTARRMQLAVGQDLEIYFIKDRQQIVRKLHIAGIYKTGLEEYDKKVAFINSAIIQQLLGWNSDEYSGFELFMNDLELIEPAIDLLYGDHLEIEFLPVSIRARFPSIFEWLDLQDYNQVLIIFLMFIVCLFNISTAVIVLIIERKTMVGVFKSMGMKFKTLQLIFVLFSIRILIWSILVGNAVGLTLVLLQDKYRFIRLDEVDYYLSYAPVRIPWADLLILNGSIVILVFLVLLIPASFIQRIDPVKVIHYQ